MQRAVTLSQVLDQEREYLTKRAPNAIEWIVGKEYCRQPSLYQHWGAYQLVKDFFELRCPTCNQGPNAVPDRSWGLGREALESEVLLVWSPEFEDDACPKCRTTRSEFVDDGLFNSYKVLHAIIGQRAGKSSTLALIGTYVEHVILTIAHGFPGGLQGYLGMPAGEPLHVTYVASTDTQAKETIWAKYRGYRSLSPWFQRYVPWIKLQESIQETPPGMKKWTYVENEKNIHNGMIHLTSDSMNSNSNGLAGRTRIASMIDEVCRMEQTDSSKGAKEIYRTMDASCQTVLACVERYGLIPWFGMICSISSPIAVDDYGMHLLEVGRNDPRMFTRHLATWDFNPWQPKSRYADLLRKDRIGTMRNFGAQPEGAITPFIERPDDFRHSAIDKDLKPTATFTRYEFTDPKGRSLVGARLNEAKLIINGSPRFMAVDAGANFDAFSAACAHGELDEFGNIITVFDFVVRLLTRSRSQEVYFEFIHKLVGDVIQWMPLTHVEFDHWNAKNIVQRLRVDYSIWAEEQATNKHHFIRFMRDAYSGYVRMLPSLESDIGVDPPQLSAQGAAIYEILALERDPKNDEVLNTKKGKKRGWNSDDVARVIVHAHRLVQDQGYTLRQDDTSKRARRKRSEYVQMQWAENGSPIGQIIKPGFSNGPGGRGW